MLDVTMTCTMRPELLIKTLRSFAQQVRHAGQVRIIANIDPIGPSTQADIDKIIRACATSNDWGYKINWAIIPCFSAAVQWVWEQVESPIFLHLEDDWVFLKPVDMADIYKAFELFPKLGHLCLRKKHIKRGKVRKVTKDSYITYKLGLKKYGLPPSFWRSELVQAVAPHLDLKEDPEKQLWESRPVGSRIARWKPAYFGKIGETPWVKDIGREWSERTGIHVWK